MKQKSEVKIQRVTIEDEDEEAVISMVETTENMEAEEDDHIFFTMIRASETLSQKLHREAMDRGEVP